MTKLTLFIAKKCLSNCPTFKFAKMYLRVVFKSISLEIYQISASNHIWTWFKLRSLKYTLGITKSREYDSVIRRMKSWVCVGIDSVCLLSTFGLELERERRKGKSWSYYSL